MEKQWVGVIVSFVLACGDVGEERRYEVAAIRSLSQPLVEAVGLDELERIQKFLEERVPRDTVSHTVYMGGDDFDCVFLDRQPAVEQARSNGLDVTAILERALAPPPPEVREMAPAEDSSLKESETAKWHAEEATQPVQEYCPKGTVPIRQIPLREVAEFGSLDAYLAPELPPGVTGTRDYATATRTSTAFGARSTINIWTPAVASGDQALSQIWVSRGAGANAETVEAGWRRTGNGQSSRLFVYFTNSNYAAGSSNCGTSNCSCFNTTCGFLQLDNTVFLDGTWSIYSASGGMQYQVTLTLYKAYDLDNWHFRYGTKEVGLWLHEYFDLNGLSDHASRVIMGGEVTDSTDGVPLHTTTDMGGDGTFGSNPNRWQHAAYQKNWQVISTRPNGSLTFVTPTFNVVANSTRPQCYDDFYAGNDASWGAYLFLGGIGRHTSGDPSNWCQ